MSAVNTNDGNTHIHTQEDTDNRQKESFPTELPICPSRWSAALTLLTPDEWTDTLILVWTTSVCIYAVVFYMKTVVSLLGQDNVLMMLVFPTCFLAINH